MKSYRRISLHNGLWEEIQKCAARDFTTTNQWVAEKLRNAARDTYYQGPEVKTKSSSKTEPEKEVLCNEPEEVVLAPLPYETGWAQHGLTKELQEAQDDVKKCQDDLDSYTTAIVRDPVTGEEGYDDPDAPYIVEARRLLEAAQERLEKVAPVTKMKEV